MSVEVLLLGTRCNLNCGTPTATYCYQDNIRRAENQGDPKYNLEAVKATLEKHGQRFSMFGGEALLVSLRDLEEMFEFGLQKFGSNSIQTNGTLITPEHIKLFKKYKVGVGISVDGPDELNDARWAGTLAKTRESTARTLHALNTLLDEQHSVSIIVTLHKLNASAEKLQTLLNWIEELHRRGLKYLNLHLLEADSTQVMQELGLSTEENVAALQGAYALMKKYPDLHVAPLVDMMQLLRGKDRWDGGGVTCTWNGCDPYTTAAVQGIDGKGNLGNCGRTCQDGPYWLKASTPGYERYVALGSIPMSQGGCKDCRFFTMCKGHCPGEGEGFDWRAKTVHCETLMQTFAMLEDELLETCVPISVPRGTRQKVYDVLMSGWRRGQNISITEALQVGASVASVANTAPSVSNQHVDTPHIDHMDVQKPHVEHIDHTDGGAR